jgi:hypothetical protein
LVLTPTRNDARRRPATKKKAAAARVSGDGGAPAVGGGNGGVAELLHTTVNLTAVTATGGDDGGDGATRPKMTGDGGGLRARGGDATGHGRARERGQTEEEITRKLYMYSDRRDQAANGRNRVGKKSNSVFRDKTKRVRFDSKSSTDFFDSWGKRKRRSRGTKPLNQLKEIESDLAGFGAGIGG